MYNSIVIVIVLPDLILVKLMSSSVQGQPSGHRRSKFEVNQYKYKRHMSKSNLSQKCNEDVTLFVADH